MCWNCWFVCRYVDPVGEGVLKACVVGVLEACRLVANACVRPLALFLYMCYKVLL